mmetsp:Transcript_7574/g.16482  ORF Transcript_7574/g.16482 Transcript_7574/m.16482 type:complete len:290 (+) Transcript_7574:206-1075(+)
MPGGETLFLPSCGIALGHCEEVLAALAGVGALVEAPRSSCSCASLHVDGGYWRCNHNLCPWRVGAAAGAAPPHGQSEQRHRDQEDDDQKAGPESWPRYSEADGAAQAQVLLEEDISCTVLGIGALQRIITALHQWGQCRRFGGSIAVRHANHLHCLLTEFRLHPRRKAGRHLACLDEQDHILLLLWRQDRWGRPGYCRRCGRPGSRWRPDRRGRPNRGGRRRMVRPGRHCRCGCRCRTRLVPNEIVGLAANVLDGEIGKLHRVAALLRLIRIARPGVVFALTIHPEHVS